MRTAVAYYWASTGYLGAREAAIADISEALRTNPFAADLWMALASFQVAGGEDATEALQHVRDLRKK